MSTMNEPQNMQIVAIACLDYNQNIHHFPADILMKDIRHNENYMAVGKVLIPFNYFEKIQLCNESVYQQIINEG